MTMKLNEIPILQYDDDPAEVLSPDHEHIKMDLPEKVVFAFLGDTVDTYAREHQAEILSYFVSATKNYPVYVLEHQGKRTGLVQAPVGAPAAVQILDWLISYGAKKIISAGSCGTLTDRKENVFLVPSLALRDEGTSYHYLPASRTVEVSSAARKAIEETLKHHDLPYEEIMTWSTDGFFRETKAKVEARRKEGCSAVEMECSALAACAEFRKVVFGELLFTGDTLANLDLHEDRDFGQASRKYALQLCLEAVNRL